MVNREKDESVNRKNEMPIHPFTHSPYLCERGWKVLVEVRVTALNIKADIVR